MCAKNTNRWLILILLACGIALALFALHAATPARAQTPTPHPAPVRVLQSDTSRVVLEFTAPAYTAQPRRVGGANYLALTIPGLSNIGESGKPQLPVAGAMIGVPPGAVAALKIVVDDATRAQLSAPPLPAPTLRADFDPARTWPPEPRYVIVPDAATYAANRLYPTDVAHIGTDAKWRSQRYLTVQFHPLQYNGATRELVFHRRVRVEIVFTYPRGQTRDALGSAVNEGPFEATLKTMLLNYDSAKTWRSKTAAPNVGTRQPRSADEWYKITVGDDGIYKLTCAQLNAAGAPSNLNPNTIRVYKNAYGVGPELKIYQMWQNGEPCDSDHYILFWAQGINTQYANKNVYWLTYGSTNGERMTTRSGDGAGGVPPSPFTHTLHLEQDRLYYPYLPMQEDTDHWYWHGMHTNSPPYFCKPCDYTFQADQVAVGDYTATLTLNLMGFMLSGQLDHRTVVSMNNHLIADVAWTGQVVFSATIPFTQTYLNKGANTLRVYETYSNILTNSFDLSYRHEFQAVSDVLRFRQATSGTWQYQIGNFTTANLQAFDITDSYNVTRIISPTISGGPPYTYQFTDTVSGAREYIVLAPTQFKAPVSVTRDTFANLASTTNGADYIIIAHGDFITNVQSLATHRQAQGLRVKVVDVQDVYDEFSDGVLHPQAIRNFLQHAYTYWQSPAPSFALLVGDGTFDVKENCATAGYCRGITTPPNSTFIPPFLRMVDPWNGETASDNYFVAFNSGSGNTLPQMSIGRLPVNSAAETSDVVAKLLAYEQSTPTGVWRSTVSFVADDPDAGGNFWDFSNQIADDPQYFPPALRADKLYFGQTYTDSVAMRNATVAAINSGRLIVNYIGHSAIQYWAGEQFLSNADIATLTNGNKLPVMLEMTCYSGYFHWPNLPSLAEVNVRRAGNGALASWAATGLGVAQGHDALNKGFFEAVMQQGVRRIGLATDAGKARLQSTGENLDLIDTYVLFGDPASWLQLQFPLYLPIILKQPAP